MNIGALGFFKSFYEHNAVTVESISQREFGIGIDKKINYRHKSFSNQKELQNFLVNETPRFISHSVGRFDFPWAQPMEKKTLLNADLIFDLDAKPEENHNSAFCNNCIEVAKQDTIRLIEKFLLPVFGFSQNDLLIVFSGSKGFHIHIRSPAVQSLSSASRRLLVDYITGEELTVDSFVIPEKNGPMQGPSIISKGWQKCFYETTLNYLANASKLPKRIKENKAHVLELMRRGNWSYFHGQEELLDQLLQNTIQQNGVQVDSPVTFDVHRLIRVPGTLHGDTGFIAKPLTLNQLSQFSASRDAAAFRGRTAVNLKQPTTLTFAGEELDLKQGENQVLISLAVLLECRGLVSNDAR